MNSTVRRFRQFELRPLQRTLLADGRPVSLGSRAFDTLVALIDRCDRVVPTDELFELVWSGVVVEENNVRQQIASLRKVLGQDAIATVPGRGYRFTLAMAENIAPSYQADVQETPVPTGASGRPERPSIAVLPFEVGTSDPQVGFLADALVEDVIALLARVPGFRLISRASTLSYQHRKIELSVAAQQLGVRYIVEGSVRPADNRLRVSTQLVEAASGHVLWTGRLEGDEPGFADLQEGIARGIMTQLEPELMLAEIASIRRRKSANVDAWGHYHQAIGAFVQKGWCEDALREARGHLGSAIAEDPMFGLAYANFALVTALGINTGLIENSPTRVAEATDAAEQSIFLDDGNAQVLGYAGCAIADLGQLDRGQEFLEQAIALDPSNAQAYVAMGATLAMRGDLATGIERMRYGMGISPRDRRLGFWGWALGVFLLRAGRREEALQEALASARKDPTLYLSRLLQAATMAALGRHFEARQALAAARIGRRQLTLDEIRRSHDKIVVDLIQPLWRESEPRPDN